MGYESNDASVLTNVSSDHLDLQGIHTLPGAGRGQGDDLPRSRGPEGWVVLNADDPLVAAVARRVRARVAYFSIDSGDRRPSSRRHVASGGRAYVLDATAAWSRSDGADDARRSLERRRPARRARRPRPPQRRQRAGGGRRRARAGRHARAGRRRPARLPAVARSCRRAGSTCSGWARAVVIVDFAHNEAGTEAILDVAEAIAGGRGRAGGARSPRSSARPATGRTTRCAGSAGSPAERAERVVIKETLSYLRGRTRESIVGELRRRRSCGRTAGPARRSPVYETETAALRAELTGRPRPKRPAPAPGPTRRGSSS